MKDIKFSGTGSGAGIFYNHGPSVVIRNCVVENFFKGVYIYKVFSPIFENNTVMHCEVGFEVSSIEYLSFAFINNNVFVDNLNNILIHDLESYAKVYNNFIHVSQEFRNTSSVDVVGIATWDTWGVTIENNVIEGTDIGISIGSGDGLSPPGRGFYSWTVVPEYLRPIVVKNNLVRNSGTGLEFAVVWIRLINNTIVNNTYGLFGTLVFEDQGIESYQWDGIVNYWQSSHNKEMEFTDNIICGNDVDVFIKNGTEVYFDSRRIYGVSNFCNVTENYTDFGTTGCSMDCSQINICTSDSDCGECEYCSDGMCVPCPLVPVSSEICTYCADCTEGCCLTDRNCRKDQTCVNNICEDLAVDTYPVINSFKVENNTLYVNYTIVGINVGSVRYRLLMNNIARSDKLAVMGVNSTDEFVETFNVSDNYTFTLITDPLNEIQEVNESNNIVTLTVFINESISSCPDGYYLENGSCIQCPETAEICPDPECTGYTDVCCVNNTDCDRGVCINNTCTLVCTDDSDCEYYEECINGTCVVSLPDFYVEILNYPTNPTVGYEYSLSARVCNNGVLATFPATLYMDAYPADSEIFTSRKSCNITTFTFIPYHVGFINLTLQQILRIVSWRRTNQIILIVFL